MTDQNPSSPSAGVADLATRQKMLETMATMQGQHNREVHPQWETQGYDYYRAIWVECAELLDHYGWKWWKHQTPDLEQSRLELVDIWHFGLSELIRDQTPLDEALAALGTLPAAAQPPPAATDATSAEVFRAAVEDLARQSLSSQSFPLPEFVAALAALPMSYRELFELYIGKNVLNRFRQANGYKEGTYRKLWGGREDNEHLMEVLAEVPVATSEYVERVFAALETRYSANNPD